MERAQSTVSVACPENVKQVSSGGTCTLVLSSWCHPTSGTREPGAWLANKGAWGLAGSVHLRYSPTDGSGLSCRPYNCGSPESSPARGFTCLLHLPLLLPLLLRLREAGCSGSVQPQPCRPHGPALALQVTPGEEVKSLSSDVLSHRTRTTAVLPGAV